MHSIRNSHLVRYVSIAVVLGLILTACATPTPQTAPPAEATKPAVETGVFETPAAPREPVATEEPPNGGTVCEFDADTRISGTEADLELEPGQRYIVTHLVLTGPGPDTDRIGEVLGQALDQVGEELGRTLECPGLAFAAQEGGIVELPASEAVMVIARHDYDDATASLVVSTVNEISSAEIDYVLDSIGDNFALGRRVLADRNYVLTLSQIPAAEIDTAQHEPAGGPDGTPSGSGTGTDFAEQWAFERIDFPPTTALPNEGNDVAVGLFDTYPDSACEIASPSECDEAGLDDVMEYPLPFFDSSQPDIQDHGVFVARLIHEVAPESRILLYRVLNNNGKGILSSLLDALQDFHSQDAESDWRVVNLSLGVHLVSTGASPSVPIVQLLGTLWTLNDQDTVIVAAAGNDGKSLPHLPAAYHSNMPVIAVAASAITTDPTPSDVQACFTNVSPHASLVFAPGGDGQGSACDPAICSDDPDKCVISAAPNASPTGYAYWSGTSFSTPLVAGLAAIVARTSSSPVPANIRERIVCGAMAGGAPPVISFDATFTSSCLSPQPR